MLCFSNLFTSFVNQSNKLQIEDYLNNTQLIFIAIDTITIDLKNYNIILEFLAFVILKIYNFTNKNKLKNNFRLEFFDLLDVCIQNLVIIDKRIILTKDLNISKESFDIINFNVAMRKNAITIKKYILTLSRRFFN